jgi:hypothetical protein
MKTLPSQDTPEYPRFMALPETWGNLYVARQDGPGHSWVSECSYADWVQRPERPALVNEAHLGWVLLLVMTGELAPGSWVEISQHAVRRVYQIAELITRDEHGVHWGLKVKTWHGLEPIPLIDVIGPAKNLFI